jgi:hypothetical protein
MKSVSQMIDEWEAHEFANKLQTQAVSGDITSAAGVEATSRQDRSTAPDPAAVEPPTPAPQQAEAGSGEIDIDLFDFDLQPASASDFTAYGIDTEGTLRIITRSGVMSELPNADVYRLYDFLMETITVWHPANRRWSKS